MFKKGYGSIFGSSPVAGSQFNGAVHPILTDAPAPAQTAPATPAETPTPAASWVSALSADLGPLAAKDEKQRSELLGECMDLDSRVKDFLGRVRGARLKNAEEKHASLKQRCREQRSVVQRLREENGQILGRLNTIAMASGGPLARLREAQEAYPDEDSWPTAQELKAAQARIDGALEAFRESEREKAEAVAEYNESLQRVREAQVVLAELAAEEKLLRGAVRGEVVRDPETGLSAVPRL